MKRLRNMKISSWLHCIACNNVRMSARRCCQKNLDSQSARSACGTCTCEPISDAIESGLVAAQVSIERCNRQRSSENAINGSDRYVLLDMSGCAAPITYPRGELSVLLHQKQSFGLIIATVNALNVKIAPVSLAEFNRCPISALEQLSENEHSITNTWLNTVNKSSIWMGYSEDTQVPKGNCLR